METDTEKLREFHDEFMKQCYEAMTVPSYLHGRQPAQTLDYRTLMAAMEQVNAALATVALPKRVLVIDTASDKRMMLDTSILENSEAVEKLKELEESGELKFYTWDESAISLNFARPEFKWGE